MTEVTSPNNDPTFPVLFLGPWNIITQEINGSCISLATFPLPLRGRNFILVCVGPDGPCSIYYTHIPNPTFKEAAHIIIAVHLNMRKNFVPEDAWIFISNVSMSEHKWTYVHLFHEHESKLTMHWYKKLHSDHLSSFILWIFLSQKFGSPRGSPIFPSFTSTLPEADPVCDLWRLGRLCRRGSADPVRHGLSWWQCRMAGWQMSCETVILESLHPRKPTWNPKIGGL